MVKKKYKWIRTSPTRNAWIKKFVDAESEGRKTADDILGILIRHFESTGGVMPR